ncbi:DUF4238 domain-containing protein [Sorangium sp. So ce1000]|uniref:DUF4238 domain-containing protein n=1 Tax=Sorangium sp. So ce1000 TaxID=3133325 RepID=UPI003F5F49B2
MRAHFVPAGYMKAFSPDPSAGRDSQVTVVERQKVYRTSVENLCVCKDYYSRFPKEDDALFREQEGALARLASMDPDTALDDLAPHLWRLKMRNRAILDATRYRTYILAASKAMNLGMRQEAVVVVAGSEELITSDDPLIVYGDGHPQEQCFILPVSPKRVIVSASAKFFSLASKSASGDDVRLLNRLACEQAQRCLIMQAAPANRSALQQMMSPVPQRATSGFVPLPAPTAIINYVSVNPRAPGRALSFIKPL